MSYEREQESVKKSGRPEGCGNRRQSVMPGKCDVRLTAEEDLALSRLAELNETSRSDVMRKALRDFLRYNGKEEDS